MPSSRTAKRKPLKLQSREIVRYAKRHGLTLDPMGTDKDDEPGGKTCARTIVRNAYSPNSSIYNDEVAEKAGVSMVDLDALEYGFCGFAPLSTISSKELEKNGYYKVGRRVAELSRA